MPRKKGTGQGRWKSLKTGKFVSAHYGKRNPKTCVRVPDSTIHEKEPSVISQDFPKGFAGTEHYRAQVELKTQLLEPVGQEPCIVTPVGVPRISPREYREDVLDLCERVEEQDREIERLGEVLAHADANLSLIRHRGFVEWGKGIPETWEIDRCIGEIRRASEGKP